MKEPTQFQCPKFQKCTAPICPIDPIWHKRKHISGDRVCFYLTEAQKPDAKAIFEVRSLGHLYELMVTHTPQISQRHHTINTALIKAKNTSSRIDRKIRVSLSELAGKQD